MWFPFDNMLIKHAETSLRSTLTAETYQMELGVEAADQLRATIVDMFAPLSRKQWEIEATSAIQLVWVMDCDSSRSALVRPTMGKPSDKRLGITIASLRQAIWRRKGEAIGAPMVTDTLPSSSDATDVCRWVDTDCMLADALTKQMSPEKLVAAITTNTWSLEEPIESVVKKRDKQRQRIAGRDQQKEKKEQQVQRQLNETHAEAIGSNDPESHDDDSPGALGDADWNDGARKLGERGEPSIQRSRNFVNSTCAAGERDTPCFKVVMFVFFLSNSWVGLRERPQDRAPARSQQRDGGDHCKRSVWLERACLRSPTQTTRGARAASLVRGFFSGAYSALFNPPPAPSTDENTAVMRNFSAGDIPARHGFGLGSPVPRLRQ